MGWVDLASVDQLAIELSLNQIMAPVSVYIWRLNAGLDKGVDCCLKTGIIASVRYVVISAISLLTHSTI
jgi:hypothetical protein